MFWYENFWIITLIIILVVYILGKSKHLIAAKLRRIPDSIRQFPPRCNRPFRCNNNNETTITKLTVVLVRLICLFFFRENVRFFFVHCSCEMVPYKHVQIFIIFLDIKRLFIIMMHRTIEIFKINYCKKNWGKCYAFIANINEFSLSFPFLLLIMSQT